MNLGNYNMGDVSLEAHHVAGMFAIGAVLFLLFIERGFRGLKIDIS
jgi:hypothetical protein